MDFLIKDGTQATDGISISSPQSIPERQKEPTETAVQPEPSYTAVSSQGDTLSISEEGRAMNNKGNFPEESDGTVIRKAVAEAAVSESENSTVNLSIYTETELEQMYLDGEITKAEYDEEISSRETVVSESYI